MDLEPIKKGSPLDQLRVRVMEIKDYLQSKWENADPSGLFLSGPLLVTYGLVFAELGKASDLDGISLVGKGTMALGVAAQSAGLFKGVEKLVHDRVINREIK